MHFFLWVFSYIFCFKPMYCFDTLSHGSYSLLPHPRREGRCPKLSHRIMNNARNSPPPISPQSTNDDPGHENGLRTANTTTTSENLPFHFHGVVYIICLFPGMFQLPDGCCQSGLLHLQSACHYVLFFSQILYDWHQLLVTSVLRNGAKWKINMCYHDNLNSWIYFMKKIRLIGIVILWEQFKNG